ncbi:MAG: carbohydrate-binding family 9-like protein [Treponema sp.]|nr:carbohydrate-binding family 9-like protein [Treponema sp.]
MKSDRVNLNVNGNFIPPERIAHYTCRKTAGPITIDGNLDKPVWRRAEQSRPFVDMVSGEPAFLETRMAALWDDENLYAGFWIREPQVRAALTERDSFVWLDNDVEVFIDGEDCYYEFEINALNTVYEALFIYQDALKRGSRFDTPEFDLYSRNVDVLCGFQDPSRYGKHRRGKRWAFMDYDFPGLKTAVKVDGRINDPSSIDQGWTVELAFPWKGIQKMYAGRSFPPQAGDTLRAAFFRFESLHFHGKTFGESVGWALNEHGVYDSHIPENFSCLHFEGENG